MNRGGGLGAGRGEGVCCRESGLSTLKRALRVKILGEKREVSKETGLYSVPEVKSQWIEAEEEETKRRARKELPN
ncbi:hypothetical protein ILYODFUR_022758 [Ilyodon furcidens]|uniref:Uncharacterized protein n=1 Tax=Ilyodon furcidens TaxID=33524 RepID=A0ABV0TBS1_9TELE